MKYTPIVTIIDTTIPASRRMMVSMAFMIIPVEIPDRPDRTDIENMYDRILGSSNKNDLLVS